MKKILYILFALFLTVSCNKSDAWGEDNTNSIGQDEVKITFSTDVMDYQETRASAVDENSVNNLAVLVFDESEGYQYKRMATLVNQDGVYTYEVVLKRSLAPKVVHFIANVDWDSFDKEESKYLGWADTELINQLYTKDSERIGMWQKRVFVDGINNDTPIETIQLIRNRSKITLELDSEASTIFQLDKVYFTYSPDKGTIAPFNRSTHQFEEGSLIEATETEIGDLDAIQENGEFKVYAFEREKDIDEKNYSALILEGLYQGEKTFYKVALIDDKNPTSISVKRNYHYKVKILRIQKEGSASYDEAKDGLADNNISLEISLEKYPIISYGDEVLEVEKYHFVITNNSSLNFKSWAKYTKNKQDQTGLIKTIKVIENDPANPVVMGPVNVTNGIITTKLNRIPVDGGIRVAKLIVNPEGSKLSRVIKITQKQPFNFLPTRVNLYDKKDKPLPPETIIKEQGDKVEISFTIPEDKNLQFPFEMYIYTKWLVPDQKDSELLYEWIGDRVKYTYIVTSPGQKTFKFKMIENYNEVTATPSENIELRAEQFVVATLPYNRSIIRHDFLGYYVERNREKPLDSNSEDKNEVILFKGSDVVYTSSFSSEGQGNCYVKLPLVEGDEYYVQFNYQYRGWPQYRYKYSTELIKYKDYVDKVKKGERILFY